MATAAARSAYATVVNGAVTTITILNGGSGYTSAPTIVIAAPGGNGTQATATATITTGGTGYTSAPTISIAPPGGTGVQATATAAITTGGTGYTVAPNVTIAPVTVEATATGALQLTVTVLANRVWRTSAG